MKATYIIGLGIITTLLAISACQKDTSSRISYNTHIRPIFSDKCFKCHGPDAGQRKEDFRLDTKEGAYSILKRSPDKKGIVPGSKEKSEVYLRIMSEDHDYMMPTPESGLALTVEEKATIGKWIDQGAVYEGHWSFQPVLKPELPKISNNWIRNEIDYFVFAKMQSQKLSPQEDEQKERLLKRVYHDLTGLPPSLAEQDAFMQSNNEKAYETVVNKLLSEKTYGEKMAIFWLDLARYADSHGYQDDGLRTMWPWRDWVIHAFNSNYGYDKFLTYQLAGDLLPEPTKESILATGFNRNHKITQEGGVIDEEYRVEYVSDRTNTFSKGMLAITLECAKCHDHKYDPISQKDYYSTFGFFNQIKEKGLVGDITLASLADPPNMKITKEDKEKILTFISKRDTSDVMVMIMKDSNNIRKTHILNRGQYDQPGDIVEISTPKALMNFDTTKYIKNRYGLAKWMVDPKNPLTARVFVNHIWQQFFGNGIVKTSGDFGLQGELPTHPELLDWLAADFMEHNWDIKRLVKQIVMSSTYRQSSEIKKEALAVDPENKWLARGPRIKLNSELLNDHILATSGLLVREIGGPSVKPYQPKGLWEAASSGRGQLATYVQDVGDDLYRRGIYHFIKRTTPPPQMLIMDGSNRDQCEVKRSNTNTPLQALVLMNDTRVSEAARYFAQSLVKKKVLGQEALNSAFISIVCRQPSDKERKTLFGYFTKTKEGMTKSKAEQILKVGAKPMDANDLVETATLMQAIQLIYNLEESTMR